MFRVGRAELQGGVVKWGRDRVGLSGTRTRRWEAERAARAPVAGCGRDARCTRQPPRCCSRGTLKPPAIVSVEFAATGGRVTARFDRDVHAKTRARDVWTRLVARSVPRGPALASEGVLAPGRKRGAAACRGGSARGETAWFANSQRALPEMALGSNPVRGKSIDPSIDRSRPPSAGAGRFVALSFRGGVLLPGTRSLAAAPAACVAVSPPRSPVAPARAVSAGSSVVGSRERRTARGVPPAEWCRWTQVRGTPSGAGARCPLMRRCAVAHAAAPPGAPLA